MTLQTIMLNANAAICMAIVLRLLFFSKSGRQHRPGVAWLAYLLILSAGFTAFRILLGHYSQVDPGEFFINAVFCLSLFRERGNLAKVIIRS